MWIKNKHCFELTITGLAVTGVTIVTNTQLRTVNSQMDDNQEYWLSIRRYLPMMGWEMQAVLNVMILASEFYFPLKWWRLLMFHEWTHLCTENLHNYPTPWTLVGTMTHSACVMFVCREHLKEICWSASSIFAATKLYPNKGSKPLPFKEYDFLKFFSYFNLLRAQFAKGFGWALLLNILRIFIFILQLIFEKQKMCERWYCTMIGT